ncbi:MAG TPA: hypothetical protein VD833_10255, partial [Vicinamibacterales bacterium]|nr:hypothetical protein [Vicinamibacterales bacterium]
QRFWLVVHARSEIDLLAAEFVAPGGRAGHEGLLRIQGQPVRGRPAILRARTSGPERMKAPSFLLLSLDGRPLQHVDLPRVDEDEFAGQIDLPAVPFRVAVAETDAGYQRVRRGLFHAELVEVRPDPADTIPAGEETALVYTIRNHGPAARFRIQATFGSRILDRVEPAVIEIPPGGEEAVTLRLTPLASESGQTLRLIVLATSEGTALPTSNSSVRELRVGQALAGPRPHLH